MLIYELKAVLSHICL